ncbi:Precorrin-6A reductase [Sulfitobacter guttiformis KCTC 32187]|uniref:Precorrin-6A reductase n=2 Tax=Sulfitobacter guttiformis TaxID=74349 RepID=A0A420DMV7_9RHOB|nr:Precorrin-6A reductase [Sulfitobacter guttiformis KCTC 32187]RKE95572.1 precorrin-6A reductase [Sulfitobacter guttiformis]
MAQALASRGIRYTAWLSEAPRGAAPMPQVPVLRRFEDASQMQEQVAQGGFTSVLDASHAFDRNVTQQGFAAACALGLPYLRLERPLWNVAENARWQRAADVATANTMIPAGARVFCATGWDSLERYARFAGEVLMLRQTRRHERAAPYPFVELVFGDPPFDVAAEKALFSALRVDLLICRNLGGLASRPKLDAAAALGLDVILIDRPATPANIAAVAQVEEALAWVSSL